MVRNLISRAKAALVDRLLQGRPVEPRPLRPGEPQFVDPSRFVHSFYKAAFGRHAEPDAFASRVRQLRSGISLQGLAEELAGSAEFQARHGSTQTVDINYVGALYRDGLGREPDQEGLANWLAAGAKGATRAKILAAFATSEEALEKAEASSAILSEIGDASQLNDEIESARLDRLVRREFQLAVLRYLPFLLGDMTIDGQEIEIRGYAAAPEGLTANMAFFINGQRFDQVDYPIVDATLKAKFSEVRGGGFAVRARATKDLPALHAARFFRFDASPTGIFVPGNWRQAMSMLNPARERFALPPAPSMQRVIGEASAMRFAIGGATLLKNMEACLGELGYQWSDVSRVLDWGCGAGRLTRYLISETNCAVTGADIDPDNIAWCRSNLSGGQFEVIPLMPPTAFADGSFDLVVGISVVTHLKEDVQFAWLAELQRITRAGGLVFLSVQGPTQMAYNSFPPAKYRELQERGFIDYSPDPALAGVISDDNYYRACMHARHYIVDRWSEYFEVVAIEDAIAALQDFVVMRRRPQ